VWSVVPEVIRRYFEADDRRDVDGVVALFADDAEVRDEAQVWSGLAEIRSWREGPVARFQYTNDVQSATRAAEDEFRLAGQIVGNFPGGTAELTWRFKLAGDRIVGLEIRPPG
jgi:hypothetical protein